MYCKLSSFIFFASLRVLLVTLFCMKFPVCLASSIFEGRAPFSNSQNLYCCRQVYRNHPNKSFSFSWRMWRSSHTQAAGEGEGENQINPTVMVDAGNWHVFHTCQAAWRALTRPIKVYRRAAGPSITMTDRSPPSPRPVPGQDRVAAAAGLESWEGPGWTGRIPMGAYRGDECWPTVTLHSGKVWMNDQLASHTQTFHPSIWDRCLQVMSERSYLRDEHHRNVVPVGKSGFSLRPDFLSWRLNNYGGSKLILSIFMFSLAGLHP